MNEWNDARFQTYDFVPPGASAAAWLLFPSWTPLPTTTKNLLDPMLWRQHLQRMGSSSTARLALQWGRSRRWWNRHNFDSWRKVSEHLTVMQVCIEHLNYGAMKLLICKWIWLFGVFGQQLLGNTSSYEHLSSRGVWKTRYGTCHPFRSESLLKLS